MATTTLSLDQETKSLLKKQGIFGETWDDLIRRLLKELEELRGTKTS